MVFNFPSKSIGAGEASLRPVPQSQSLVGMREYVGSYRLILFSKTLWQSRNQFITLWLQSSSQVYLSKVGLSMWEITYATDGRKRNTSIHKNCDSYPNALFLRELRFLEFHYSTLVSTFYSVLHYTICCHVSLVSASFMMCKGTEGAILT